MDHLGTRARIELAANRVHVVEPLLDHHSLRWLGELISDEALESPLRVFEVAAADHEHQRLPATFRYGGRSRRRCRLPFEVDVELQWCTSIHSERAAQMCAGRTAGPGVRFTSSNAVSWRIL